MHLISINIASGSQLKIGSRLTRTGIDKSAASSAEVGLLGLHGDLVANQKHHGGPDQAVYVYSAEDYAWWSAQLGRELRPGTFGENLTLSAFGPEPVRIGDRYAIGAIALEVTAPRIPCSTLAAHVGERDFIERFRIAERPGFYARVLTPGVVRVGDPVSVEPRSSGATLIELYRLWYKTAPAADELASALAAPIAVRMRARYEKLRADLTA